MRKIFLWATLSIIAVVSFLVGRYQGQREGRDALQEAVTAGMMGKFNSGIMNLLFLRSGSSSSAIEMNRETVFWNIDTYQSMIELGQITGDRVNTLKEMILQAKDFAEITGMEPFPHNEAENQNLDELLNITYNIHGEIFQSNPIKVKRDRVSEVFEIYRDQRSHLYDFFKATVESAEQPGSGNTG